MSIYNFFFIENIFFPHKLVFIIDLRPFKRTYTLILKVKLKFVNCIFLCLSLVPVFDFALLCKLKFNREKLVLLCFFFLHFKTLG